MSDITELPKESGSDPARDMERVRELLFGATERRLEAKLQQLMEALQASEKRQERRILELSERLEQALVDERRARSEAFTSLTSELASARKEAAGKRDLARGLARLAEELEREQSEDGSAS